MQITQVNFDNNIVLKLSGRFTFDCHKEFTEHYNTIINRSDIEKLFIDLYKVEYLDSTALGMLLLLKERAAEKNISVCLRGCNGTVKHIIEVAGFHKLFPMDQ